MTPAEPCANDPLRRSLLDRIGRTNLAETSDLYLHRSPDGSASIAVFEQLDLTGGHAMAWACAFALLDGRDQALQGFWPLTSIGYSGTSIWAADSSRFAVGLGNALLVWPLKESRLFAVHTAIQDQELKIAFNGDDLEAENFILRSETRRHPEPPHRDYRHDIRGSVKIGAADLHPLDKAALGRFPAWLESLPKFLPA